MKTKRQIILCRGGQASGKTTWANKWCNEDPEHRIRFNDDDVKHMMGENWHPKYFTKVLRSLRKSFLDTMLSYGYNIVIDDLNLLDDDVSVVFDCVKEWNQNPDSIFEYDVTFKNFYIDLETALERNRNRDHAVDERCIKFVYDKYRRQIEKFK